LIKKGDLVKWIPVVSEDDALPYIVVRGPREGYFEDSHFTRVMLVVDLMVDGKIMRNIPLSEIEPWIIE
jgi:hypothetical protein